MEQPQNPKVSFVVPCYKLAHLLKECVDSILAQTFADFEILIMDDCSPDNTAEVAASFSDPRVRYIRNDPNLGALRNYNKGFGLSRGEYLWLISADDYLRKPYVLQRYVELLDANPRVGYVCCPGVGVRDGVERDIVDYSVYSDHDEIVNGHKFFAKLLDDNIVLAPTALARRQCYDEFGMFPVNVMWAGIPIDMVWGGDWYLWLVFALTFDVAYFVEAMVCYREHSLSMTNVVTQEKIDMCWSAEMAVLAKVRQKVVELGLPRGIYEQCLAASAKRYGFHLVSSEYKWLDSTTTSQISMDQFEKALAQDVASAAERKWVRARTYERIADQLVFRQDVAGARNAYLRALMNDPLMFKIYPKLLFLFMGKAGERLRGLIRQATLARKDLMIERVKDIKND